MAYKRACGRFKRSNCFVDPFPSNLLGEIRERTCYEHPISSDRASDMIGCDLPQTAGELTLGLFSKPHNQQVEIIYDCEARSNPEEAGGTVFDRYCHQFEQTSKFKDLEQLLGKRPSRIRYNLHFLKKDALKGLGFIPETECENLYRIGFEFGNNEPDIEVIVDQNEYDTLTLEIDELEAE